MSKISRLQLAEIIGEKTLQVNNIRQLAREVAAYLIESKVSLNIDSLMRDVMEYRSQRGIIEATANSAHAISDKQIEELKQILQKEYSSSKNIIINSAIDKNVIGGIKITMPNQQLDMSLRDKLDTFKRLTANIKD